MSYYVCIGASLPSIIDWIVGPFQCHWPKTCSVWFSNFVDCCSSWLLFGIMDDDQPPMAVVPLDADDGEPSTATLAQGAASKDDKFQLPFSVATIHDLEQRAYINNDNQPEWLYRRAHHYMNITKDAGRLLRENKSQIQKTYEDLEVPVSDFHYRGQGDPQDGPSDEHDVKWKDHTMGSFGLLAFLHWVLRNKALKATNKVRALGLFLALAQRGFEFAVGTGPLLIVATLLGKQGNLISAELVFSPQGLCHHKWAEFLQASVGAIALWGKLTTRTWLNRCTSSSIEHASYQDILFFLAYTWCHPRQTLARQNVWDMLGKYTLPIVINKAGQWMNLLALHLGQEELKQLPVLRTKTGRATRMADPVNKVLLLWKLRKQKIHRRRIASTHDEFGAESQRMIHLENYVDCLLHLQTLEASFPNCRQLSVSWDPSSYGGKDTLVAVLYDPKQNIAAYLPNQQLPQVMMNEVEGSLLALARSRKLTRIEGFKELRGFSASLRGVGLSLSDFKVPAGLICRPLTKSEFRLVGPGGEAFIMDEKTNTLVPQIPPGLDLGQVPLLAALNFTMFSNHSIMLWAIWDPFHRAWNDIKNSLKATGCKAWRVVLELTLVANINYGPFGSSAWFYKKRAKLEQFLQTNNVNHPLWQQFQHLIAIEKRQDEPTTLEQANVLFDSMRSCESFINKGPLIKLMRWFSWFESMAYLSGEMWITKMVLLDSLNAQEDQEASANEIQDLPMEQDHKKELQNLKKRKGTWKLAPSLITERSMSIKDCIMAVAKSTWKHFSSRAKEILSPQHVLEHNISCAARKFWAAELVETIETSLWDEEVLHHLTQKFCLHDQALHWHCDILDKLLETRSMSLTSFYSMPPIMYNHLLAPSPAVALAAHKLAIKHWKIVLEAEEAKNAGSQVDCLEKMYWRLSPVVRCLFLAYEQDEARHQVLTAESKALQLQVVIAKNLGDSRLIENAHQHGRDLYRSAKSSSFSNTTIMANTLRSGALEERKVACAKATEMDKAMYGTFRTQKKEGVAKQLRSQGHDLGENMQRLMVPKSKVHTWPSPSPASLFGSTAATMWLFHYWGNAALKEVNVNSSWLSCIAKPGAILAQRSTSMLVKVLASTEFAFLGALVQVDVSLTDRRYVCRASRDSIFWHFITDLEDWCELQVEPCLITAGGAVGWAASGGTLPMETALCLHGPTITFQQIKKLIIYLGGEAPKGTPSKKVIAKLLIEMVVPEDQHPEALAHMIPDGKAEDVLDSDMSELISELGQDDGNAQDLKDLKDKKKLSRMKRNMKQGDEPVLPRPKRKAKGKGKGKGKKPGQKQGKKGLWASMLDKAKKKRKEEKEAQQKDAQEKEAEAEAAQPPPPPAEIFEEAPPAPASSSADPPEPAPSSPPAEPASSSAPPPQPAPSLPPAEEHAPMDTMEEPRRRGEKKHSSPEILEKLDPPGCKITLGHSDHRFASTFEAYSPVLEGKMKQSYFSRTFVQKRNWQTALIEVHKHNWTKWLLVKDQFPLPPGKEEQVPGEIPQEIFDQLAPIIAGLGEVVRYSSTKRKAT